jgi:hypothetical protein
LDIRAPTLGFPKALKIFQTPFWLATDVLCRYRYAYIVVRCRTPLQELKMKKIVAAVALMTIAGAATASETQAETQVKVLTEFYKGNERLYSLTQTVPNGKTVGLNAIEHREYIESAKVTRTASGEIKGEPKFKKGEVNLGFDGYFTPRILSNGEIRVVTKFSYVKLVEMQKLNADGVDIESPHTTRIASEPQFNVQDGKPFTGFTAGTPGDEYRLVVTATTVK